jgi:hypothetical protein
VEDPTLGSGYVENKILKSYECSIWKEP